jgi:hypothetical protein
MRAAAGTALVVFVVSAATTAGLRDGARGLRARPEHPSVLSLAEHPGPLADAMSMEHGPAFADLWWLQVVQEVGSVERTGEIDFRSVFTWLQTATDFDPRYLEVYYNGAVFLSALAKDAARSNALLLKGLSQLPDAWRLWMLLGFNRYFIQGDFEAAAEAWWRGGQIDGSPPWLPSLAARSRYQAGDREAALAGLQKLVDLLPPGERRELAQERLDLLRNEGFLQRLDAACDRYFAQRHRLPDDVEDLREAGLWSGPDRDLLGGRLSFEFLESTGESTECVTRSTEITSREVEAASMAGSQASEGPEPPPPSRRQP